MCEATDFLFSRRSRREFLWQCAQGASLALLPAGLGRWALALDQPPSSPADFYFHPRYRTPSPLDAVLLQTQAGLDSFISEQCAGQVAACLEPWSSALLESPRNLGWIAGVLAEDFAGSSLRPSATRVLRSSPGLEVQGHQFSPQTLPGRAAFLDSLRSLFGGFSHFETVEFQVTSVQPEGSGSAAFDQFRTRIRYELVGAGDGYYRQQRVGQWELLWTNCSSGLRVRRWQALNQTQAVATARHFADVTVSALGSNLSYAAQLTHGTDYWRTVLDGACGIDIYGHNGVAVGDLDGNGFDDLYVCQPAGLPNRLYRNRGDGTLEDITETSGVGLLDNTACALFVDVDNDGRQDLIVVRTSGPILFLNQGSGKFLQKQNAFHFAQPPQGTFTGAAVADYDRDGWLDIYFCLYAYYQGADQYNYPTPYFDANNGPPNFLLGNNRDGTFRDVTQQAGLDANNSRYSFCCAWGDANGDGWPDLYVVNDFGRKNLYRNRGDGTFTDVAGEAGVEDIGAGMSACWLDYSGTGARDLYVADMWTAAGERITAQEAFQSTAASEIRGLYRKHAMGSSLFRNQGSNFADVTSTAGVGNGRWAWSSDEWDFDHDGFPDIYIANGMISGPSRQDLNSFFWRQVVANSPSTAKPSPAYEQGWNAINELVRADGCWSGYERNVLYANNRDGTFADVSGAMGLDFIEDGRAFALADFDHDGRQEIFLKNRNGPQLRILKNVVPGLPPSISFRLTGRQSNRDAVGAAVVLETEAGKQTRFVQAGSGFLSQHSKEVLFGLGSAQGPFRALIRWPNGLEQRLEQLPANHRILVTEGVPEYRPEPFASVSTPPSQAAPALPSSAEALPTDVETWLLAPVAAPEFALPDTKGQILTLAAFRGQRALLSFCAPGSEASRRTLAAFRQYHQQWASEGLKLLSVIVPSSENTPGPRPPEVEDYPFPVLLASDEMAAIYSVLFRYLFDRHRDLPLPTSFLLNENAEIVKVYQGRLDPSHLQQDLRSIPGTPVQRLAKALPFPGISDTLDMGRNALAYGSTYFQRGYLDQARRWFDQALRENPASAEALYGLGSVDLEQNRAVEAQQAFERVIQMRPAYPDTLPKTWNNLGLIAARSGRTEQAIDFLQRSLGLSPDYLIALINLGNAYRQQKNWPLARTAFERALQLNPRDPEANYGLGMVFAQTGDTAQAAIYLQSALQSRPDYPEALNNLGILFLRAGRRDDAVRNFQQSIREAPSFDQAYLNLARVYALEGKRDEARALLQDLLKHDPRNPAAHTLLNDLR